MKNTKKKIIVGLSGGVDSAVAALLLKQQGHDTTGIYMQNWETDNDDPFCTAIQDLKDAKAICKQLEIPFKQVNFAKEYWHNVFQHCLDEFKVGRTPNPDIWCNREIKFKVFLQHALALGADYLATGHYAKIHATNTQYQLLKAKDKNKDQSYFLYTLGQRELKHSLFPLADLEKPQVREIAKQHGFLNYAKKDSTGICFIGERKFKDFLREFLLIKPGPIETPEGKKLGQHDGLMFYTIGQRKGLYIGGQQQSKQQPWYVLDKDMKNNILIVGQGHDHPLLYSCELVCTQLHWISGITPTTSLPCFAKTRYRQADQRCEISAIDSEHFRVIFDNAQRAITAGQSVVFYDHDVCLGGGIIESYIVKS